ncbi:MAG TPA: urease accessory protein UreD [Xanthobacteraceae bacterium]|jgi:urease accessory protein
MRMQEADRIFAANRAVGRVALSAKFADGATRRARTHEQGAWRVRCPGPPAPELEAMIVNSAGGMAGGDRFELDFAVGPGARLLVTSAAAEKVYRTLGAETTITARLDVAAGGELAWLPQETILFDRARLRRTIAVDLAADARLLLAEAVIFGRSGMGESVAEGLLVDRWCVRRGGRLLHAEAVRLDGDVAAKLAQAAVAKGGVAIASVLLVPGDDAMVAAVRDASRHSRGEVGASAWNGIAVVRLAAPDGAALRHDLARVLATIRGGRLPRLWLH